MKVRSGARTDIGRVRDHNEDTLLVQPPLFAVADGMGGHAAGEVASSLAVATVSGADGPDAGDPETWLGGLMADANAAVFHRGTQQGGPLRMGTTLTVAYAAADALYLGHVGDSRAYLLHDGRLRQLTDDHSLVAEWVRQGRISAEEAAVHPQRSVITRALGIESGVEVDVLRVVPQQGDRLLLCSDGLTGCVGDAEIAATLRDVAEPDEAAARLVHLANEGGGDDNITAVVVDVLEDPVPSSPPPLADTAATEVVPVVPSGPRTAPAATADTGVVEHAPPRLREPPRAVQRQIAAEERGGHSWVRFAVWAVALVALVSVAWFGLAWYTRNSFYVGSENGAVAIYRGLPGGVFGAAVGQELYERTPLQVSDLPENTQKDVAEGIRADGLSDAETIVTNLYDQVVVTSTTSSTTTTTATTSTTPAPVPVPVPVPTP